MPGEELGWEDNSRFMFFGWLGLDHNHEPANQFGPSLTQS